MPIFPGRWYAIKVAFSKSVPPIAPRSRVRLRPGERGIWQRRYWEHTIRDDRDYALHMDYIHFNPVKHRFASAPADWPCSSFRLCVAQGLYPRDWIGGAAEPARYDRAALLAFSAITDHVGSHSPTMEDPGLGTRR